MKRKDFFGKFAVMKGRRLLSGYFGVIKILHVDANGRVTAVKPDGGLCEVTRHEVKLFKDQRAGWGAWSSARGRTQQLYVVDRSPGRDAL